MFARIALVYLRIRGGFARDPLFRGPILQGAQLSNVSEPGEQSDDIFDLRLKDRATDADLEAALPPGPWIFHIDTNAMIANLDRHMIVLVTDKDMDIRRVRRIFYRIGKKIGDYRVMYMNASNRK